jgi:hypothetical protein
MVTKVAYAWKDAVQAYVVAQDYTVYACYPNIKPITDYIDGRS